MWISLPSETSKQDMHVNLPGTPNTKVIREVLKFKKKSNESEVLPTCYQILLVQFCPEQFICHGYICFFFSTLSWNCRTAGVCQLVHEVKYTVLKRTSPSACLHLARFIQHHENKWSIESNSDLRNPSLPIDTLWSKAILLHTDRCFFKLAVP